MLGTTSDYFRQVAEHAVSSFGGAARARLHMHTYVKVIGFFRAALTPMPETLHAQSSCAGTLDCPALKPEPPASCMALQAPEPPVFKACVAPWAWVAGPSSPGWLR